MSEHFFRCLKCNLVRGARHNCAVPSGQSPPRPTILDEAAEVTAGDRGHHYGHPADNHGNTADLWTAYLKRKGKVTQALDARDVCLMMVLLKISRDANREKRDNLVDIAGYARNAEMIEERDAQSD